MNVTSQQQVCENLSELEQAKLQKIKELTSILKVDHP